VLTGTMRDEKGPLAFFDGTQSDHRKVLKPNDTIAGFTITEIEHAYVKLKSGTNEVMLPVNMQLGREEEGQWQLSPRSESSTPLTPVFANSAPSSSYESRQRGERGDRNDRRDRGDRNDRYRNGSGGSENAGPNFQFDIAPPPDVVPGEFVPAQAPPGGVSNGTPASVSNGAALDILEILRRRREQENNQ
jgi:hypothetical protein